jgi:hypothetical protein
LETEFLSVELLFDYNFSGRLTQQIAAVLDTLPSRVKVLAGNLHSLASGESVRFDDKIAKVQQVLFDAIN